MKATISIIILFISLMVISCNNGKTVVAPVSDENREEIIIDPPKKECGFENLTIVLDKTMSEADETMPQFAEDLQRTLEKCSVLKEISIINIGLDGQASAFRAVSQKIRFPALEIAVFDDEGAKTKSQKQCGILAVCRKRVFREAETAFHNKYKEDLQNYHNKFQESLGELRQAIMKKAEIEVPFSDIDEMAQRISLLTSSHVIWLTDAAHNALSPWQKRSFPNSHVLIGVMPTRSERSQEFEKKFSKISYLYAGTQIVPATEIDDETLLIFLKTP